MVVKPRPEIPIGVAQDSLSAIYLFPVYQRREDLSPEPPPPDYNKRAKHWFDPAFVGAEDDGEPVVYRVVQIHPKTQRPVLGPDGKPRVVPLWMTKAEAGSVNIPYGDRANEVTPDMPIFASVPVPLRELHPMEEIRMGEGPMAGPIVVNKAFEVAAPTAFTEADRKVLQRILALLEGK